MGCCAALFTMSHFDRTLILWWWTERHILQHICTQ